MAAVNSLQVNGTSPTAYTQAKPGDIAITNDGKIYILSGGSPLIPSNWKTLDVDSSDDTTGIYTITKTLTSSDLLNLAQNTFTTNPLDFFELIPAPGVGKTIILKLVSFETTSGSVYSNIGGGLHIFQKQVNIDLYSFNLFTNTFNLGTQTAANFGNLLVSPPVPSDPVDKVVYVENTSVKIGRPTSNALSGGDKELILTVEYFLK